MSALGRKRTFSIGRSGAVSRSPGLLKKGPVPPIATDFADFHQSWRKTTIFDAGRSSSRENGPTRIRTWNQGIMSPLL